MKANRTVAKGAGKGERVTSVPGDACPKLLAWPHVCNGCSYRRYHCSKKWRCEYSAARAQAMSDELLSAARRGVDRDQHEFEAMMETIHRTGMLPCADLPCPRIRVQRASQHDL